MKNKRFLLGMLVLTLVFGIMVSSCSNGSTGDATYSYCLLRFPNSTAFNTVFSGTGNTAPGVGYFQYLSGSKAALDSRFLAAMQTSYYEEADEGVSLDDVRNFMKGGLKSDDLINEIITKLKNSGWVAGAVNDGSEIYALGISRD